MKSRPATIIAMSGLLALSGCLTTGGATTPTKPPPVVRGMQGGLVGTSIGKDLGSGDRRAALDAEYKALEYTPGGQSVSWKGEDSGTSGQVVPGQPYRVGSQDCRQYTHTILSGGASESARGTACRNANGSWTPLT
ncbi:MAG: RT0821/Lpp0805 family surface protein [Rhizobiaceae bacterium]